MDVNPGYKRTEVGVIPEDWEVKRLGDLGTPVRGASPRPAGDPRYFNGNFIPWLTVGSLTNIPTNQLFVTDTATGLTEVGAKLSRTLRVGTLVIVNSGARTLGVSKLLAITCCANDGIAAILDQSAGEKRFLCYFLNSQIQRLRQVIAAGNDQLNLNTGRIALIAVPFPRESEQHAIAEALSDVDTLLDGLDRLIAKKRDVKLAARQALLTGGTRLPGFHGEWSAAKISELCEYEAGVASAGGEPDYVEIGDIDVESKSYDVSGKDKPAVRGAVKVPAGTLLVSTVRPTRGAIAITREEIYVSSAFCRLRPANGLLFHLVCQAGFLAYLGENSIGGTYPTCRDETILNYVCPVPGNTEEQRAIAKVLSDMDAEIMALEARRDKTRALKQAMMQELLTGKTRLVLVGGAHA